MGYYNQLQKFIAQAKTTNLKTKHFASEYLDTNVRVSFGQGNAAKIPWVSFLIEPNKTSDGIYPVYLYYKEYDLLILAYGVSETNKPQKAWDINNGNTIEEYFKIKFNKKPDRYGSSFIYKVYNLNEELNESIVNRELDNIIRKYSEIDFTSNTSSVSLDQASLKMNKFADACNASGLIYSEQLITRFISSLATKPFVLLSGLSGSGKTKLAEAFVKWISANKDQYCIVPVGADWTNREPLLGYVNALDQKEYILPENKALELIIKANDDQAKPYFLILDEMNLSHVERYFADFLSIMETQDTFKLHSSNVPLSGGVGVEVAKDYKWPNNLFVIGTVNIDETTYMFSPKVLDRANVIEFRVSEEDLGKYFDFTKPLDLNKLYQGDGQVGLGAKYAEDFVKIAVTESANKNFDNLNKELTKFFIELQEVAAEFGYRTISEIQTLFNKIEVINTDYSSKEKEKIDIAIMQKLLPKLHGSRSKLAPVLKVLASLCYKEDALSQEHKQVIFQKADDYKAKVIYPISLEKITRMHKNVIANGFTSYAQA